MHSELAQYPVTFLILGITVYVSWRAMERPDLKERYMLNPYAVWHGKQWERLVTHGVLHRDWMHLALNMYVLYVFGGTAEETMTDLALMKGWPMWTGHVLFFGMYLGSVLAATAPALFKHRDSPYYNSLGASGGVSGVVMSFVLCFPGSELLLFFIIPIPAVLGAILFFVYEYAMAKRGGTGVAHDAHIGGAIFGALFTTGLAPQVVPNFWNELLRLIGLG